MPSPTEIVEFKDFSNLLSGFPVLFKEDLFSRTFQESPLNSSIFQACANPETTNRQQHKQSKRESESIM